MTDLFTMSPAGFVVVGSRDDLTGREEEMLRMISQGYSNKEIAATLYLSINSVKTYIRSAYRKIGIERRAQAVIWGINEGLSEPIAQSSVA